MKWVKVKKKYPKESTPVLGAYKQGIKFKRWIKSNRYAGGNEIDKPKYWAPLPDNPLDYKETYETL